MWMLGRSSLEAVFRTISTIINDGNQINKLVRSHLAVTFKVIINKAAAGSRRADRSRRSSVRITISKAATRRVRHELGIVSLDQAPRSSGSARCGGQRGLMRCKPCGKISDRSSDRVAEEKQPAYAPRQYNLLSLLLITHPMSLF